MRFPVIAIKDGVISFKRSPEQLATSTAPAFKKGWFKGLTLLDADGLKYTVMDAKNPKSTGRKLYPGLFAPKIIDAELQISLPSQLTVSEMRELIRETFTRGIEFLPPDLELNVLLREVDSAETIQQLWDVVVPVVSR